MKQLFLKKYINQDYKCTLHHCLLSCYYNLNKSNWFLNIIILFASWQGVSRNTRPKSDIWNFAHLMSSAFASDVKLEHSYNELYICKNVSSSLMLSSHSRHCLTRWKMTLQATKFESHRIKVRHRLRGGGGDVPRRSNF